MTVPDPTFRRLVRLLVAVPLLLAAGLMFRAGAGEDGDRPILLLTINDAIGPATSDYIERGLLHAVAQHAELVVVRLDTPGGLDTAMRDIVKNITNSAIPVACYVAPTGARAASAGTYIMYASHIAAMAPGTNLGAATPVQLAARPAGNAGENDKPENAASNEQAIRAKAVNDAVAYIRGLAELHGRNQAWAEKAVREGASLQASEALKLGVIDLIASTTGDLLRQVNGRKVIVQGRQRVLHTTGLAVVLHDPDWRTRLLSVITNPNVAYILLLVGIYGLIFEFSNPGAIIPGTVGAISLLLALYALQLLPINYAGVGLLLLGIALMVAEAFEPSFGILGIGGVIAFLFGSVILMETDVPGFGIDLSVIVTFTAISALMFIFIVGMAIKARRRPVVSGMEQLVGAEGVAMETFEKTGPVSVHSEIWQAMTDAPLQKGQSLRVVGRKGLTLQVEPVGDKLKEVSP